MRISIGLSCLLLFILVSCSTIAVETRSVDRESLIPTDQVKISPTMDVYPPKSLTDEFSDPIPLPYPVNTRGAEDSAFITPDGNTLYVWYTPNPNLPAEKQLVEGVTAIYVFHKQGDDWTMPKRVNLQDNGKQAMDGCEFVLNDRMWFCSAREGYTGINWFTADLIDGVWQNWQPANFNPDYQVGELHITADGKELYFHSQRTDGKGGLDIWVSTKVDGEWQAPVNVSAVNTPLNEGWPFVSPDGTQLWFTRSHGAPSLWRSMRVNGVWTDPVEMFAPFAGEASMDQFGNIYFSHHFFKDYIMLEADIYMAEPVIDQ